MISIGKANRIGATAQALLARGDWSGRLLAVVSEAAYLIGSDGALLWLAQETTPLHPRAFQGSFNLSALRAEMPFSQQGPSLQFASPGENQAPVASLAWANASVWQPAAILPAPRPIVQARWHELLAGLAPPNGNDSLGQLLPLLREMATGGNPIPTAFSSPFLSAAIIPFLQVARACRDRETSRLLTAGLDLIGLGPGLTPGGDDFMGGLLFVAHHLNTAYPGALEWESPGVDDWLTQAHSRTNAISYAILADHAAGQSVEPMHALIGALLSGRQLDELLASVPAVLAIGSTSGWDMLTGALTGLLLVEGRD